jgi:hypothetical protein
MCRSGYNWKMEIGDSDAFHSQRKIIHTANCDEENKAV